jgi:hypothetical protein
MIDLSMVGEIVIFGKDVVGPHGHWTTSVLAEKRLEVEKKRTFSSFTSKIVTTPQPQIIELINN